MKGVWRKREEEDEEEEEEEVEGENSTEMLRWLIAPLENMVAVGEFNSPDDPHGPSERRHAAAVSGLAEKGL